MRKISTFLLAISCAIAVILSTSCKKEEDAIPVPTTTFDKTQIESKTYSLGDSVKADIEIVPNRPLANIIANYETLDKVYLLNKKDVGGSDGKFVYPLRFKLDDRFKGTPQAMIIVKATFAVPDDGGRTGVFLTEFYVKINQ